MKKIFKYRIPLQEQTRIDAPISKPLTVQIQHGELQLWAEVREDGSLRPILLNIIGTGFQLPMNVGEYLCTVQQGDYVWHVYWRWAA